MAIKKDTLDQLLDGRDPKEVFNKDGLFDELKKALAERVLNAELDDHLESEAPAGRRNHRNGHSKKTVLTETAKLDIRIPRDREGTGRASSTSRICSRTKRRRAMSRRSSARVFGGSGTPSGVRSDSRRPSAFRTIGLKPRTPRRAKAPFMRLTSRVRSPTRFSRSRIGRLASSSCRLGTAAMPQWSGSSRSQPRKARLSSSVSSRSVLARRCSRETATLVGWIAWASMPSARSQRASRKPSRQASKATAVRWTTRPAPAASPRQRRSSRSSASCSGSNLLEGVAIEARHDGRDEPARVAHL